MAIVDGLGQKNSYWKEVNAVLNAGQQSMVVWPPDKNPLDEENEDF